MTKSKQTKSALFSSVVALLLCFTMLLGTTFAWFTGEDSSSVNKIQAGTLDIQLLDARGNSLEGKTLSWQKAEGHENDEVLWEPGCTYNLQTITIKNKGNLALKYKIEITGIQGDAKLNEAIDWTITNTNTESGLDEYHSLAVGAEDSLTISGTMKTTAGNEYQGLSIDGIAITVLATQDTVESDSYDNQYDEGATYPVVVSNQQQVNDAITNATDRQVNISIAPGQTVTLDNDIANEGDNSRDVTFIGNGSQTVDVIADAVSAEGGQLNYQRGSSFTFENLTIKAGEGNFDGIVCDELTFKNCTIKGKLTLFGKATYINCTFDNTMANQYSIWTWGGTDVTFENCTFNTNGKAILLFGEEKTTNLTVKNCTFNDRNGGAAGKAAIEIGDANYGKHNNFTVVINGSTVASGFAAGQNTGSTLWANKNSMDAAHLTVTINGTRVQ